MPNDSQLVAALYAAAVRVYPDLAREEHQRIALWVFLEAPRTRQGYLSWRAFELGRLLFERIGESQNWRCCYCGIRTNEARHLDHMPTIEHVLPKVRGGADHPHNMVLACHRCNVERGIWWQRTYVR